jgi:hypothetical protein
MNTGSVLFAMLKADFLERTRRSSFLVTVCLVIYLGYAVNSGQILIKLDAYRGIYNSAWVGSMMALVITFFLGIAGFYLVKNTIERDERSGVGQILATTPLTRPQYLLGKWLSNFTLLSSLVAILALAAVLMQVLNREDASIQLWALIAPFLFIALPMMALVAAFAVFFETVSWLKGGFGNLVYFFVFMALLVAAIFLSQHPWLDVTGIAVVGENMKAAVKTVFPTYSGSFVLTMIGDQPLKTFLWPGLNWTIGLILQRLMWLVVSIGVVLLGAVFFNRFDPSGRAVARKNKKQAESEALEEENASPSVGLKTAQLTPLAKDSRFHNNFFRLVWMECKLLVKGLRWYWLAGMAVLWIGCVVSPSESLRKYWLMMAVIWPVLVWSKMGEREVRYQAEQLIFQAAFPLTRLLASAWLAGVLVTAAAASGALLGRLFLAEPLALLAWIEAVCFIPTLALTLGVWSRSSKVFEVIYPILWYLGPFNRENGLAAIDYLGMHAQAPANAKPLLFAGVILALLLLAFIGRRQQIRV